jgi:outer membrane protein assembly factor BamB
LTCEALDSTQAILAGVAHTYLPSHQAPKSIINLPRRLFSFACFLAAVAIANSQAWAQHHWPQFRGAESRGVAIDAMLPEVWSATENVAWKTDIPGRGWSSPIVWGDKVFLTTVVNTGEEEAPKKGLYFGGDRPMPSDAPHQWKVVCLSLKSGEILWDRTVHEGKPASPIHLKNSYASETPVTDGEAVYCMFGNVGLWKLDFDGNVLWTKRFEPLPTRFGWGPAASPVLFEDRLYLVNDNDQDSYLAAFDKQSGEEVWRVARDEKSNWATPFVWKNDLRTEIVVPGTGQIVSYDLQGQPMWSLRGMSSITIATPYEADGLLIVTSGYILDTLKPIYAIRPGAEGDITPDRDDKEGEKLPEGLAWWNPTSAPYNPSTLAANGRLYVLYDRGFFACYDLRTGKEIYGQKRIPNGRAFTSSPWFANGLVYCLNEDGVTFAIDGGDEFRIERTNLLADDDMCMATPAIAQNRLLIRTAARLYCIAADSTKRDN